MRLGRDLCVAVILLAVALVACKKLAGKAEEKSEDQAAQSKSEQQAAQSKSADEQAAAASGDQIGVPACDEFLKKYEDCVTEKVPQAQREALKAGMKQWRDAWKQAAATPVGKAGLEAACKQQLEASKQSMSAWGCDF
jgi:hypothetical protein